MALAGVESWREDGLRPPAAVVSATHAYRAESDAIGEWISERCMLTPAGSTQAKTMYDDYATFINSRGGSALSMRRWAQRMMDRGFHRDEGRVVHYLGITLATFADLRDPVSETSPYMRTRAEFPNEGHKGRDGRADPDNDYSRASRGE